MESILWFLIMGVLFFFMMRFGCGAHMGGGHMGHMGGHEPEQGPSSQKVKDPVCGMEIDKDQAYSMTRRQGKQIFFCSEDCQNKFNADSKRYF